MLSAPLAPASVTDDLTPEQKRVVCDDIIRIRQRVSGLQESIHIHIDPPRVPLTWQIRTAIRYCQDVISEMDPLRLSGYGRLDGETAERLQDAVNEVDQMMTRLDACLDQCGRHPE